MPSRSMNRNNSQRNNSNKSKKQVHTLSASKATFAAKLAAFICEDQNLNDVVGDVNGFFLKHKGRKVNTHVFGVLPFLHMNISKKQFMNLLNNSAGSMAKSVENMCNSGNLENKLEKVQFNCKHQSQVGNNALLQAICDSIENGWTKCKNGRKVLTKIQKVQLEQNRQGIIPASSVKWCC